MTTELAAAPTFQLPESAAAHEPPEARGLARDAVRLMVSQVGAGRVEHGRFADLPDFLYEGDLLVVNESATIPAALRGVRRGRHGVGGEQVLVHLSSPLIAPPPQPPRDALHDAWVIELRRLAGDKHTPLIDARAGESIELASGGSATLVAPYPGDRVANFAADRSRLWIADLALPLSTLEYAALHGDPIRYSYVPARWPLPYYQTVFAREAGSAEMPSAGRPFTKGLLFRLASAGVNVARLVSHTGVSSLDSDEAPYPERLRVSAETAAAVNRTRREGGRVIAVGTTVVRALESAASPDGVVRPTAGWTNLVVTPERGAHVVGGLVTGLHDPTGSHLALLEAFAPRAHLEAAYHDALRLGYLWHEFGDSHLILP